MFKGKNGLSVAFTGDISGKTGITSKLPAFENIDAVKNPVDILFSSQWPCGISKLSKEFSRIEHKAQKALECASAEVSNLCRTILPKYHISPGGCYFEREWYRSLIGGSSRQRITKFISLGDYDSSNKSVSATMGVPCTILTILIILKVVLHS